jgi:hypothetical protein
MENAPILKALRDCDNAEVLRRFTAMIQDESAPFWATVVMGEELAKRGLVEKAREIAKNEGRTYGN